MTRVECRGAMFSAALIMCAQVAVPGPVHAQIPTDRPFAMRGVELGISLSAFRTIAAPDDEGDNFDIQTWCSDTQPGSTKLFVSEADRSEGIVDCQWYSRSRSMPKLDHWEHWISIGNGKGIPTFRFIPVAGELRLFRVSFYANEQYHADIRDALTRGYGPGKEVAEPFQTAAGANTTSLTSIWINKLSSIKLVQRCGHLERYCLTYDHTAYAALYKAIEEKRAAAAASKI